MNALGPRLIAGVMSTWVRMCALPAQCVLRAKDLLLDLQAGPLTWHVFNEGPFSLLCADPQALKNLLMDATELPR
jgi:hypothetical protein